MLCFYFHFSLNSKVFQSAKLAGKLYGDTIPHLLNRHHSDTTLSARRCGETDTLSYTTVRNTEI